MSEPGRVACLAVAVAALLISPRVLAEDAEAAADSQEMALGPAQKDSVEEELRSSEPPSLAEARTAFLEGRELMEEEEWLQAKEKFSFAARRRRTPGLLYYIGYTQERAGLLVQALGAYDDANLLLKSIPARDVDALIPPARSRVMAVIPQVRLRGLPDGARLFVDEVEGSARERISLNPGKHEIRVTKAGFQDFRATLILALSQTEVLDVEMKVEPEVKPFEPVKKREVVAPEEPLPRSALQRGVFWGSLAVGATGIGVGVTGAVMMGQAQSDLNRAGDEVDEGSAEGDSSCLDPSPELAAACNELASASDRHQVGTALLVGGAVGATLGTAGALVSHYFWPQSTQKVQAQGSVNGVFVSFSSKF